MAWVHTWFGLVLGYVLMIAFFFGALSVFDREIDRWALPETRFEPQIMPSYDKMLAPIFAQIQPDEDELAAARKRVAGELPEQLNVIGWGAYTTHRDPVLAMYAEFAVPNNPDDPFDHIHGYATIDPRSGEILPGDQLKIGSEFFYPMHYGLHLHWKNIGIWIIGIAALVMLAALVSGVIMHRKLFKEFFTFRPHKRTQRSSLDLHNLTGVVALPFHFIFALSGLTIFASLYFPVAETQLQGQAMNHAVMQAEEMGLPFAPAGVPGTMASVDAMVAEAKRRWAARDMPGEVGSLWVAHAGDSNSYVSLYRAGSDRVALVGQGVHFDSASGAVLYEEPPSSWVFSINDFLTGLHLQHFEHWLLRWFYVLGGLMGCVCIATGFIFFVEKRKRQHAQYQQTGLRWVDALAVTTVTGIVVASLSILVANRILPAQLPDRGNWEEIVFWFTWLLTLVHGAWRSRLVSTPIQQPRLAPAWREQCYTIVVLAVGAVLLNWITTGDHLFKTIADGYWPVAGLDLMLLTTAAVAAQAARILRRRELKNLVTESKFLRTDAEAVHG